MTVKPIPDGYHSVTPYLSIKGVVRPVQDQFFGDRTGTLEDPFGHVWFLATRKEELTPDEIARRAEALSDQNNA